MAPVATMYPGAGATSLERVTGAARRSTTARFASAERPTTAEPASCAAAGEFTQSIAWLRAGVIQGKDHTY